MIFVIALNYYKNNEQLHYHSLPLSTALHILPELKGQYCLLVKLHDVIFVCKVQLEHITK